MRSPRPPTGGPIPGRGSRGADVRGRGLRLGFLLSLAAALACNLPMRRGGPPTPEEKPAAPAGETPGAERHPAAAEAASPTPFVCDQPQLNAFAVGPGAGGGVPPPILSLAFLELPFPYDGGNEDFGGTDAQFRKASQVNVNGGRINSFFDHLYPLYPSEFGREPSEPPIGKHVLAFDGVLSETYGYSGHPAYDFSTFEYHQPTTPVFAAADGVVAFVGEGAGGALTVKLNHTVEGIGDFQTIYMHLHPDEYFAGMVPGVGKAIAAGTRIGTMGNTGFSTGHHLHFEVRFDVNGDGIFTLSEVVDPYGYIPSAENPNDPWGHRVQFTDAQGQPYEGGASMSPYLWLHPLGAGAEVPEGGGEMALDAGEGEGEGASVCVSQGSLPPGGTLFWAWSPDPLPTSTLSGIGESSVISAVDEDGEPVEEFDPPLEFEIPFDLGELTLVDPATLGVYWLPALGGEWAPLLGHVDLVRGVAYAQVSRPGQIALLGLPARDLVPPTAEIRVSGPTSEEGDLYARVAVTLEGFDPSGVELLEYSLDNGNTWQEYSGPFELDPNGVPLPLEKGEDPEESFGAKRGQFLLLVSARDGEGNVIDPPVTKWITIDPTKNPDPTVTALVNANCRFGPGLIYTETLGFLLEGQTAPLEGRLAENTWFRIPTPGGFGHCWVSASTVATSGDLSQVPIVEAPPLASPTPTVPPYPPVAPSGLTITKRECTSSVYMLTLVWRDNATNETGYRVYRDGALIATRPADATGFQDFPPYGGPHTYGVEAYNSAGASTRRTVNESGCVIIT